jgi:hypothetical protein
MKKSLITLAILLALPLLALAVPLETWQSYLNSRTIATATGSDYAIFLQNSSVRKTPISAFGGGFAFSGLSGSPDDNSALHARFANQSTALKKKVDAKINGVGRKYDSEDCLSTANPQEKDECVQY